MNTFHVYADNAATTQISRAALDAMIPLLEHTYGNPSSLHTPGQQAAEALNAARNSMAHHLNCRPKELIFTSGGSEADNHALIAAAALGKRAGKRHIISTALEHHAVLHTLEKLKKDGFEITLLQPNAQGIISVQDVENALQESTCLVSVMFANNEIGTIQPIEAIGAVCQKHHVLFHTDAVQAAGHLTLDVEKQHIDLLSLSAHKFHGPKGVGALYVKSTLKIPPLIEGGAQENGKRAGTENIPSIVGMAAAFDEAHQHMKAKREELTELRNHLMEGLEKIPHSALNGDRQARLPGNISFCFEGIEGESLLLLLDQKGIYASSGSACTSGSLDPSHVLLAIGRPHEIAHGSLRLTLSTQNTQAEIDYIVTAVAETVDYLRKISPLWSDYQKGKKQHVI